MTVIWQRVELPASLPNMFEGLLSDPFPVYLDSSLAHSHLGRYSYLAADPFLGIRCKNGLVSVEWLRPDAAPALYERFGQSQRRLAVEPGPASDPFAEIQAFLAAGHTAPAASLPPFQGGAIGYFGYGLGRHLEALPSKAVDDVGLPDLFVGLYDWVLAHDHFADRTWIAVNSLGRDASATEQKLRSLARRFASTPVSISPPITPRKAHKVSANFSHDSYLRAVSAAKERIAAGDIYEVCVSQRLDVDIEDDPWQIYKRLRAISPVPYGAYFAIDGAAIVSGSPELFLRLESGKVETRPIKGTRPRGADRKEDLRLAAELTRSEKERAENLMIVDLLRNDIGKVCRTGSVHVPELFRVETYSTVHQMVSVVRGDLRPDRDAIDLLRACFPGGSVTGCPKIRAMGIIDQLEPTRRGVYCGSIGLLGFNGQMESSIVIRTIVAKDRRAYFQVGGAIVADSEPEAEYQETLDKARASLLALNADGAVFSPGAAGTIGHLSLAVPART